MELPNLGKQCTEATCKQLDFLPLKCKCGQLYCPEHFQKHAETCTAVVQPKDVELKKIEGLYVCSEEGCKSTSVVPIICERCNKHFCITHRHLTECRQKTAEELAIEKERYAEPVRRFNEAKKIVDGQVTEKLENAKKKPKSSQMASKVQLMRIKGKATGNKGIPTTDRVYFNIEHPKTLPPKSTPVFVSKTWTVGRSIDAISSECKVANKNNVANSLKLRLFKKSGNIISESVSATLNDLLQNNLIEDGENLLLEYVADDCTSVNQ